MTRKNVLWLMGALTVTPLLMHGCGGDDSKTTTGTAGSGGSTTGTAGTGGGATGGAGTGGGATGGAGGGATGGAGGTSGGSAGTAGSSGAGPADSGTLPDGRTTCGGTPCSTNPIGTNLCDTASGRCVDCLTDADCAVETTNKYCDTAPNSSGLPAYNCEECTQTSHCQAGYTCSGGDCVKPCGTAMCETGEVCDLANNRCIDCLGDADCADETTDKHCDLRPNTAGLPTGSCEECIESAHCPAGEICVNENCEPSCTTDANCSTDGGGNSPYCHPTTRICTECTTDTHCAANTANPYCTPGGDCESCITDAHCTNAARPYCDDNECVACRTSADCPAPQTCNNQGTCSGGTSDAGGRG